MHIDDNSIVELAANQIDAAVDEAAAIAISYITEVFNDECEKWTRDELSNPIYLYDSKEAKLLKYNSYKWIAENVKLIPEIVQGQNHIKTVTFKVSIPDDETLDDYRIDRLKEILANVSARSGYTIM